MHAHRDAIVKATLQVEDPHAIVTELGQRLGDRFNPVVAGPVADLNPPEHNKAIGLARLARLWRIDLSLLAGQQAADIAGIEVRLWR